jgi:hypothetical protein
VLNLFDYSSFMFFLNFFGSKKDTLALIETGGSILFAKISPT